MPDICIIDLQMQPMNGYEAVIYLNAKMPAMRTMVLSVHHNKVLLSKLFEAGACCYLSKNCPGAVLSEAIEHVLRIGYYYTDDAAETIFQRISHSDDLPEITNRELRFLCLCATDLSYKEIAQHMKIETRTVENYRDSLFKKLQRHTRTGLACLAITTGLINLSTEYLFSGGLL